MNCELEYGFPLLLRLCRHICTCVFPYVLIKRGGVSHELIDIIHDFVDVNGLFERTMI